MIIRFMLLVLIYPNLCTGPIGFTPPDTTQESFSGFISGTWKAKKIRESSRDFHVCLQQSYTLQIDKSGKIFNLQSGDGNHFKPAGGINAVDSSHVFMQLHEMRYKYKIIIFSKDSFRMSHYYGRKEKYPDKQRPVSDPINKKRYKPCDTETWFFNRKN